MLDVSISYVIHLTTNLPVSGTEHYPVSPVRHGILFIIQRLQYTHGSIKALVHLAEQEALCQPEHNFTIPAQLQQTRFAPLPRMSAG
jgi:hypothetical protein